MKREEQPTPIAPLIPAFRPEMAFPCLTDEMIARLHGFGTKEFIPAGTKLWEHGQRDVDMFVLLEGVIEVLEQQYEDEARIIATLRKCQFSGEIDLLSSRRTLVDGRTAEDSTVLRVPRGELQRLMRTEGDIANLIMQATIWRRIGLLEASSAGLVLLGSSSDGATIQLQRFLTRNTYPHRLIDPVSEEAEHCSIRESALPAVVFADGRVLHRPSIAQLSDELGLTEILDPAVVYDLAVVGAGPSGLAAAVYGASEGLSTIVLEGTAPGGQAGTSSKIENYLGFPTGVSGQELANRAQMQAQKFGARLAVSRDAVAIDQRDGLHELTLADGTCVCARSVIIAVGAQYRKLNVANYARFEYQGIHYAATAMEATLCRNQDVAVIGGGNSAGQAALFLSGIAEHVHLIIRGGSLDATMSRYLIARIESSPKITLHSDCEVKHLDGGNVLECATWHNKQTGEQLTRRIGSMFVMIGAEPNTGWLYGTVKLDKKGFIMTGGEEAFENTRYATNVPGIYAVGDVRSDSIKRVASAVGEGSVVISDVHKYLAAHANLAADANSTLAALQSATALASVPAA